LALVMVAGCGQAPTPRFKLNFEGKDRADYPPEQIQGVVDALTALWGTPDDPYVFPESGLDLAKIQVAAGPTASDRIGKHRGLYREHCAHCHGVTGDGDGPTALFLNPYPRDYRRGIFKFKATQRSDRPAVADLKRVIQHGVPGTAMPSFGLLPDQEVDALVEYVRYLSMRGETELLLQSLIFDQEEALPLARELVVEQALTPVAEQWKAAEDGKIIIPQRTEPATSEELQASIVKGWELFLDQKRSQCTKCHGPTALGDGGEQIFDDWNKDKTPENADLWSLPKQELRPRNLRLGIYRGGRRPADIYRRIYAGINGTPMPAAGPAPGNTEGVLSSDEIWHVVDYILSLPYERGSEPRGAEHQVAIKPNL